MSDRFECSLDDYLADIFAEKLRNVIEETGYVEVLRIPEPNITEFRRSDELLTLQIGHPHAHKRLVAVESETVNVDPLVTAAVRDTIVEVSDQLLSSLPWLDRASVRVEIASHISDLVSPTQ